MEYILKNNVTGKYFTFLSRNCISEAIRYTYNTNNENTKSFNLIKEMLEKTTDTNIDKWCLIPYEQEIRRLKLNEIYFKK